MKDELPSIDTLIALAKSNPDELERLRKRYVEQLIDTAPESIQRRLRGLQFQIDSRRSLHTTPMGSCIMLSKMMLDSLSRLNSALHGTLQATPVETGPAAAVIPFPSAVNQ